MRSTSTLRPDERTYPTGCRSVTVITTVEGNEVLTCAEATTASFSTRRLTAAVSIRTSGVPELMCAASRTCAAVNTLRPATSTDRAPKTELNATNQVANTATTTVRPHDDECRPPPVRTGRLGVVGVAQIGRRRGHGVARSGCRAQASRITSQSRYTLPMPIVMTRSPGRASSAIRSGTAS